MIPADQLAPEHFAAFFEAVHGSPPFPWQKRLLQRIADQGEWPAALDLPTGSGKTAALDVALFHLALEAEKGESRRAPVRIAFVVDRRLIVDDAFERARRISEALFWSLLDVQQAKAVVARLSEEDRSELIERVHRVRVEAAVARVAARLARLAERRDVPLIARRLRGGVPREDDWARTPSQPTILCSTVDQVGSRLLFRGYGIRDRMKPVHAGLLGSDCLILLDEAHLAEPFRQTLTAIERLRQPDGAPWQAVVLTATPVEPDQEEERGRFSLDDQDHAHPVLSRRLAASKPARLVEIQGRQGVASEDRRVGEIAEQTKLLLNQLRGALPAPAIGVVVNRVIRARRVFNLLKKELADAEIDLSLIIGPARAADREQRMNETLAPIRTGADRTRDRPLILVATQTIEAGVDIDLDGLVTEAAPLDALRQRFGRLNRDGRPIASAAVILAHKDDVAARADDPVYNDRIAVTWKALTEAAGHGAEIDFSINQFPRELDNRAAALSAKKQNAPVLMPAYADLWSQTWPIPNPDPEPALFLHGSARSAPTVQIVWRADLEFDRNGFDSAALFSAVPPKPAEAVEVSLAAARRWLREQPAFDFSDAAGREDADDGDVRGRRALRWAGPDDPKTRPVFADQLRPHDLIVVPCSYGGCDKFGWDPESTVTVTDIADLAAAPFQMRRFALRLFPALVEAGVSGTGGSVETAGAAAFPAEMLGRIRDFRDGGVRAKLGELISALVDAAPPPSVKKSLKLLGNAKLPGVRAVFPYGDDDEGQPRGVVLLAPKGVQTDRDEQASAPEFGNLAGGVPATEDDGLGLSGEPVSLCKHSCDVRDGGDKFASSVGLSKELAEDVALAGFLHDAGKADPRFQAMLYGGDWFAVDPTKILAKSRHGARPGAWERSGLPPNWRHEALSVRLACEHAEFGAAHDKGLVLWLVGVHHGFGRPFFPHADGLDEEERELPGIDGSVVRLKSGAGPQSLAFDFNGSDWPQIFERLKRSYGIWGLARLEAIVRLADHRASEDPAKGRGTEGER